MRNSWQGNWDIQLRCVQIALCLFVFGYSQLDAQEPAAVTTMVVDGAVITTTSPAGAQQPPNQKG